MTWYRPKLDCMCGMQEAAEEQMLDKTILVADMRKDDGCLCGENGSRLV